MQYFVDSCALPLAALILFSILIYTQTFGKPRKANPNDAAMKQLKQEGDEKVAKDKAAIASKQVAEIGATENALGGVTEYHKQAHGYLFFPPFTFLGMKYAEGQNKITHEGSAGPRRRDYFGLLLFKTYAVVALVGIAIYSIFTVVQDLDVAPAVTESVMVTVASPSETATTFQPTVVYLEKVSPNVPQLHTMYCAIGGPAVLRDSNGNEVPNPQGNYRCFVLTDEWSQGTVITAPWDGQKYLTLTEISSGRILYIPFDYMYGTS